MPVLVVSVAVSMHRILEMTSATRLAINRISLEDIGTSSCGILSSLDGLLVGTFWRACCGVAKTQPQAVNEARFTHVKAAILKNTPRSM
mmetsp:Transcript_81871/g.228121  ORF Transcript_81871/g.228121 Transcript_81871/m.228121 type:complete len:89 (+) Transcript_81871:1765-2031(+)